ncbi:hypothetical protein J5U21_00240 [Saccharolobus shibatae]|uniref:Uncharacterized protein n=1 Tax=Saccharolobus shibatae TaxID=2286 RepID=A0A8F5BSN6_9CREN|nr:hypothetical protein J5U21_00240 [Saccharolobus shibatae]
MTLYSSLRFIQRPNTFFINNTYKNGRGVRESIPYIDVYIQDTKIKELVMKWV